MSESDETIIEIGNDGQFDIPSLPTLELPSPLSFKFVEKLKELELSSNSTNPFDSISPGEYQIYQQVDNTIKILIHIENPISNIRIGKRILVVDSGSKKFHIDLPVDVSDKNAECRSYHHYIVISLLKI